MRLAPPPLGQHTADISRELTTAMLAKLPGEERERLVGAMQTIESLLNGEKPATFKTFHRVRRDSACGHGFLRLVSNRSAMRRAEYGRSTACFATEFPQDRRASNQPRPMRR